MSAASALATMDRDPHEPGAVLFGSDADAEAGAQVRFVHVDRDCIVVDKPAGLLSVPGLASPHNAWRQVAEVHDDALIVHRLDMSTSGLMIFARGVVSQRRLSAAFSEARVGKRYVARVDGRLEDPGGEIDLPVGFEWSERPLRRIDRERGKPALTRWTRLGFERGATRLELEPVTGRTHQLRLHLAAIGHPILGDALYAPRAVAAAAARLLLHAQTLRVPLADGEREFASPAPF